MKKFILLILLVIPIAVNAKTYLVGVVAPYGSQHDAAVLKAEIESFVTGTDEASVQIYSYLPSADTAELDSLITEADSKSDIILLFGEVPAGRALHRNITKKSIAVFNSDVECSGSFDHRILPDIDYNAVYASFKELLGFTELKVAVSSYGTCISEICRGAQEQVLSVIDVPFEKVKAEADYFSAGDTALILEQPQMLADEFRLFLGELADKGVKTFSFGGYHDAELGVLAVNSRDRDFQKTARSAAVAVMDIINGTAAGGETRIDRTEGLVINMETASAADFSPAWSYLRSAELMNYEKFQKYDKKLGFKEVLEKAVLNNEDVLTGQIDFETARYMVDASRSAFKPSVGISSSYARIDDDRARYAQGTAPEKTLDVSVQLQQIIYSEEVFSLRDQAVYNKKAAEASARQAELDILSEAAKAYLAVLRAQTYMRIAGDNLETTKYNYNLAKNRDIAGAANPAELHRWEATIALSKIDLVNAANRVKVAMSELARVTGEDIDGYYDLEPLTLEKNYSFLAEAGKSSKVLDTPRGFTEFKRAMEEAALENSVELRSIRYLIDAAGRSVETAERRFYHPTVALQGEYTRFIDKSGEGAEASAGWYDDTEWNIGVKASLPLYEGGRRGAELHMERAALRKLGHQKAKVSKLIRQRMITALENARSSYDSYLLAGESALAADKTLKIVSDLYARGAVSITELIDAQNAKVNAEMNEASGLYSFMEKIVDVERAFGAFSAFSETEENTIINILNNLSR